MHDPRPSREVRSASDGLPPAGRFGLPDRSGTVPAVLLTPGSGQTHRNDNARSLAINRFPPSAADLA